MKVLNIAWNYDYVNILKHVKLTKLVVVKINTFGEYVWNNYENMEMNLEMKIFEYMLFKWIC